jgi:hypothetical protein
VAKFAPDKFELIHFTNPKEPEPESACSPSLIGPIDIWDLYTHEGHDLMPIQHQAMIIQSTESARYLGIWLDKTLSFDAHRIKAINRANSSLEVLRNITGST